uniref:U5 small nuclear ribonucleoprotein helicase n=1 Tax=Lygus hesperus TaxID=30085 RepID=A0A0A9Z0U1_LYGHE
MNDVATFCNAFPDIQFEYESPSTTVHAETANTLSVLLQRMDLETEEAVKEIQVPAALYPENRTESWYIVLADVHANRVWGMKRIVCNRATTAVKVPYRAPATGIYDLQLLLLSDSWVGVDRQCELTITVE